jgi:hypothetical protein
MRAIRLGALTNHKKQILVADLDLKNGLVMFDKAVRRTGEGFKITAGTKTAQKGVRQVPLGANLTQLLCTLKAVATANGYGEGPVFTWQGKRDKHPKRLNNDRMRYAWADAKASLAGRPAVLFAQASWQ